MADAMCGPANPLQQFKQQTTLDRSLQQDRLSSRQNQSQGFRSKDPNAAFLDPEFEAFQAGIDVNQIQPFHQLGNASGPSNMPSWASDFQQLNISSPPFQQQYRPQVMRNEAASWTKGFLDQRAEMAPRSQTASPSPQAFQQRARYGLSGFQSSFTQPGFVPSTQNFKGKAPVTEQFDEAAFERAFDQANEDLIAETHHDGMVSESGLNANDTILGEQPSLTESLQQEDIDWRPEQAIHGTDIEYQAASQLNEKEKAMQQQQADDDALAATAQELLEKINHNKTEKFKNSQFLGLMRKLRDREMRVEGDKMVETANATTSSTSDLADATLNPTSASPKPVYLQDREQLSSPLPPDTVTTQPHSFSRIIPPSEQDYDSGRTIDPTDGQAVVDLLNQRGPLTDDMGTSDPVHVSSSSLQLDTSPYVPFDTDGFITP